MKYIPEVDTLDCAMSFEEDSFRHNEYDLEIVLYCDLLDRLM